MVNGDLAPELDMKALAVELEAFLSTSQTEEWIGLKLGTLLVGFIKGDMVPAVTRVAEMGIDPSPILETVAGVLRIFADNLRPPQPEDD